MMRAFVTIVATTAWLLTGAGSVLAQDEPATSSATIDAVTYAPIPPGAVLVTQPETQGEMDDSAWRLANDDLASRGYQIGTESSLVFTVATQLVDRLSSDRGQLGESAVAEGMQFSSNQQTLLNPDQPINRNDRVFRVTATVYDRANGAFVWRGTAQRSDAEIDATAALRIMLPALLDHFGQSVEGLNVPLAR